MKSIKTYLPLLFLLIFFNVQAFSQASFNEGENEGGEKEQKLSKTDSIIVNTYFSEEDYNELYKIEYLSDDENSTLYYGDEVYGEEPFHKNKHRNRFWDTVGAEIVVDVVVNTVFFLTLFWQ